MNLQPEVALGRAACIRVAQEHTHTGACIHAHADAHTFVWVFAAVGSGMIASMRCWQHVRSQAARADQGKRQQSAAPATVMLSGV